MIAANCCGYGTSGAATGAATGEAGADWVAVSPWTAARFARRGAFTAAADTGAPEIGASRISVVCRFTSPYAGPGTCRPFLPDGFATYSYPTVTSAFPPASDRYKPFFATTP